MDSNSNEEKSSDEEKIIENLLRHNMVRSDTWIAKSIKGTPLEKIRKHRRAMEDQGKLPYFDLFIDSNGNVKPRDADGNDD